MQIAIGCDHAGTGLKEKIRSFLSARGHDCLDLGTNGTESKDFLIVEMEGTVCNGTKIS